jgi:hypothetical protein
LKTESPAGRRPAARARTGGARTAFIGAQKESFRTVHPNGWLPITGEMSVEEVLARVSQLETMPATLASTAPPAPTQATPPDFGLLLAGTTAPDDGTTSDPTSLLAGPASSSALLDALQQLARSSSTAPAPTATAAAPGAGARLLAAAETQVGQSEQPPGSNDGPAIATYRSAVPGSRAGDPWCAEFVSWAAAQAGAPLGDGGTGFRSVAALTSWAALTGRLLPAGSTPQPGDLILFGDRHVGIVQAVEPNGTIDTVEGNYGNAVQRVQRSPSEATGFVRL